MPSFGLFPKLGTYVSLLFRNSEGLFKSGRTVGSKRQTTRLGELVFFMRHSKKHEKTNSE